MITLNYDDFTRKGLKDVIAAFKKAGLPVSETTADNKQKRESGFAVKQATLTFESGQTLVLKLKAGGSLYQAKLNGKILAVKDYLKPDTFIAECVSYVQANEATYLKQKEKAAQRVKVAVPREKAVNLTVAERTASLQSTLADLAGQTESTKGELATATGQVSEKRSTLDGLKSQLAAETAKTEELQKELEGLQSGIMESAGSAPAEIDREQIAKEMMLGGGRHPALKAAFVEGFNNSCSMEDAIVFIQSFTDEELMTFLKQEENIMESADGIAALAKEILECCPSCAVNGPAESISPVSERDMLDSDSHFAAEPAPLPAEQIANLPSGTEVIVAGRLEAGDAPFSGETGTVLESADTVQGLCYKVRIGGMVYRGIRADMVMEAVGQDTSIDRSGYHDITDPAHVDDPEHDTVSASFKRCPWCGAQVEENKCINCSRQYDMAVADRAAWIAANKELPADDFPAQYE